MFERVDGVLRELRSLGAAIAECDLGYPVEEATFEDGASAARIDELAALVGEPLPQDYRYFLTRCAGFVAMDFHNGYAMHPPELVARMFRDSTAPKRLPAAPAGGALLPVAGDGGGNLFLLGLGATGAVLRWDHESGGARPDDASGNPHLTLVADGFTAFLERIRDDWRHFLDPESESWDYIT